MSSVPMTSSPTAGWWTILNVMKWMLQSTLRGQSGIYEIVNTISQKRYVGRAVCLWTRFKRHCNDLARNKHRNIHLQRAYNKNGPSSFEFRLQKAASLDDLVAMEQFELDRVSKLPLSERAQYYNLTFSAVGPGNCLAEEGRRKISQTLMGHKHSLETLAKIKEKSIYKPKHAVLIGPDDVEWCVEGIREFCNQQGLKSRKALGAVISGKQMHYRGWRLASNKDYDWRNEKKTWKKKT